MSMVMNLFDILPSLSSIWEKVQQIHKGKNWFSVLWLLTLDNFPLILCLLAFIPIHM